MPDDVSEKVDALYRRAREWRETWQGVPGKLESYAPLVDILGDIKDLIQKHTLWSDQRARLKQLARWAGVTLCSEGAEYLPVPNEGGGEPDGEGSG